MLVLAAAGLVYGSLLAFRQPDVRGVVAYSSMAQMGLIVLGIFSRRTTSASTGAVLHSVSHGLVSAAMFLLAAMLIQRTGTDRFADLGGLAKGRPALATLVLVVGMLTLAVPGSANFAGEFAILAGVFTQGWGYAAVGRWRDRARRDVLAAADLGRPASRAAVALCARSRSTSASASWRWSSRSSRSCSRSRSGRRRSPSTRSRARPRSSAEATPMIVAAITTPHVDWLALSPALALLAAAAICLLGAVLVPSRGRRIFSATIAGAGFITSGVLAAVVFDRSPQQTLLIAESMSRDRLAALAQVLVAGFGLAAVLVSWGDRRRDHVGEYYALLAAAGGGMAFFVCAGNLMTLFLGLEWFSISLYILVALDTHRKESLEAGLKYLIVGSFGSAILLFGSALTYGATGELGFNAIRTATGADDSLFVAGMAMIIAGLAFKASAAPFHMWTPDVYEGAPTPVTAFMSAATKAVALVVTLRILVTAFPEQSEIWSIAIAVLAVISLVIGNLAALAQRSVKRLLAYSSVSQAGFMLIAIAADNELGGKALLFYLIPYGAASIGAFAVVAARERELGREVTLATLEGWGWERPFYGAAMWVFMLTFAGFPFTGGMIGKFYVFSAAYEAGWWWLIVIGVVATAISIYYYLAVVRAMYMRPASARADLVVAGGSPPPDPALEVAIGAAVLVAVGSFFFVQPLIDLATKAVILAAVHLGRSNLRSMSGSITWLGHAAFRFDTPAGDRIYVDPVADGQPVVPCLRARAGARRRDPRHPRPQRPRRRRRQARPRVRLPPDRPGRAARPPRSGDRRGHGPGAQQGRRRRPARARA